MYRDSLVERRERAALRLRDVVAQGTRALALRYGATRRGALQAALDVARDAGVLDELEPALDAAEACVAECESEHARVTAEAAPYAELGPPASSAFVVSGLGFPDPPSWRRPVAEVLRDRLRQLALTGELIAAPRAEGIALFFIEEGLPFRLDVEAKLFDNDNEFFTTVSLVGRARAPRSAIAVRPQTFGDDLLAALRIRRDRSFGDEAFDPLYFVSGKEDALEDFFTADVRAAFVRIARREPVIADIGNGLVTVELKTQPVPEACAFVAALQ